MFIYFVSNITWELLFYNITIKEEQYVYDSYGTETWTVIYLLHPCVKITWTCKALSGIKRAC